MPSMFTTRDILLNAIAANPSDAAPKLAYMDWCKENDEPLECPRVHAVITDSLGNVGHYLQVVFKQHREALNYVDGLLREFSSWDGIATAPVNVVDLSLGSKCKVRFGGVEADAIICGVLPDAVQFVGDGPPTYTPTDLPVAELLTHPLPVATVISDWQG